MDYRDIEWFALETNREHSVVFEIASKYCILDSFVDYDVYYVSSKGFLPTVVYKTFFDITIISIPNELIDLNNSNVIKDHIRYLFYL